MIFKMLGHDRFAREILLLIVNTVLLSSTAVQCAFICPAQSTAGCQCSAVFNKYLINCDRLGALNQVPQFQPSNNIFDSFTISSQLTTIATVQALAFDGIGVRLVVLSRLAIKTVNVNAFVGMRLQFLEEINLSDNEISHLAPKTFRNMTNLQHLDLSNNQLTSLEPDIFSGLAGLETLSLFHNRIESLPDESVFDVFGDNLSELSLHGNMLKRLNNNTFTKLKQLKHLKLHDNRLQLIDISAFSSMTLLVYLSLHNNQLGGSSDSFNWNVFSNLVHLQTLDLSNNNIQRLSANALASLLSVTSFTIAKNQLQQLPSGVFDSATKLQELDMSNNRLTTLPNGLFRELSALGTLSLRNNDIRIISESTFTGMQALQTLDISENAVESLPVNALSTLTSLTAFVASNNNLHRLHAGTFSLCSKLSNINLKNNDIHILPSGVFSNLSSLTSLLLQGNSLPYLEQGVFSNLSRLNDLELSSNNISTIDDNAFIKLGNLKTLSLDNNAIKEIPSNAFSEMLQLRTLRMNSNKLVYIGRAAFRNLKNLNRLMLANNAIGQLHPQSFADGSEKLQILDLQDNQISTIPPGIFSEVIMPIHTVHLSMNLLTFQSLLGQPFAPIRNTLQYLYLSANKFTSIPDSSLTNLPSLRTLLLDSNQISTLSANSFDGLISLLTLSLSNNLLTSASLVNITNLPELANLQLVNNSIDALPDGAFSGCPSIKTLALRDNRISQLNVSVTATIQDLTHLDVAYNRLSSESIVNLLSLLPKLNSIHLEGNNLGDAIDRSTFVGGESRIDVLDLSNNDLTSDGIFPALINLKILTFLSLDNNKLTTLPTREEIRDTLGASVKTLSLRNNLLSASSIGVLSEFIHLVELHLDGNRIAGSFPIRLFSNMFSLTHLSVDNNQLEHIDNHTFDVVDRTLSTLSLANNSISSVDNDTFSSMLSVIDLDLSRNSIRSITFPHSMAHLHRLSLASNLLQELPIGFQSFPLLLSLDLSNNSLRQLSTLVLYSQNPVQLINLSDNWLVDIDNVIYIGDITNLNLSHNNLTDIERDVFYWTARIGTLDLSYNEFEEIPSVVTKADDVVSELRLENNKISQVDSWVGSGSLRPNLQRLFLHGNQLTELSMNMMNAIRWSIVQMDLRDNQLTRLEEILFENATHLMELNLAGNPWLCNCQMSWIRTLPYWRNVTVDWATCQTPSRFDGVSIMCFNITDCQYANDSINPNTLQVNDSTCFSDFSHPASTTFSASYTTLKTSPTTSLSSSTVNTASSSTSMFSTAHVKSDLTSSMSSEKTNKFETSSTISSGITTSVYLSTASKSSVSLTVKTPQFSTEQSSTVSSSPSYQSSLSSIDTTTSKTTLSEERSYSLTGLIIGVVLGGLVLIIAAVVTTVFCVKKHYRKQNVVVGYDVMSGSTATLSHV